MRTAIFGGTFDPVHRAHLVVAREAAETFSLDRVLFIPAANPPLKEASAGYEDRFRMVQLACEGDPRFIASRLEELPGKTSRNAPGNTPGETIVKSYSIHTIERVKADAGPEGKVFFIIGADAFAEIQSWYRWQDVLNAVDFIVVARPGHVYRCPPGARVHRLETVALPFSSSEIRHALARGEMPPELPPAVGDYIRQRGLYGASSV